MRSLFFVLDMLCLLPVSIVQPFVGVLLWDWIAFMNPHQMVWGFGSHWPWALASFVVTVIGWAFSREPKQFAVNPTTVLMVLFMIGITVNMPFALAAPWTEHPEWLRVLKMFLFFIITACLLTDKRRIDALIWIIAISMGFWILYQGGASVVTLGAHKAFGPPSSMISDNNIFAAALLVVLPLLNYLRLQARHRIVRLSLLFVMAICFLAVVASYSRGAFLGIFAVTIVLWWRSRNKALGLIVLGAALAAAIMFMPPEWFARMHTIDHYGKDGSAASRLFIWRVAWLLALHHPLTGVGFGATTSAAVVATVAKPMWTIEIHGIWFQALGEQGFPVFFIWLAITLVGVFNARRIVKLTRDRPDLAWANDLGRMVQVSIVAYAVTGTFLPIAYWDIYFTVLVALQMALVLVRRELRLENQVPGRMRIRSNARGPIRVPGPAVAARLARSDGILPSGAPAP
jgi:probable O-glycosylation ligase (exosortase A-associated)